MGVTNLRHRLRGFPMGSGLSVTTFVVFNSIRLAIGTDRRLLGGLPRFSMVLAPRTGDVPVTCRVSERSKGPCVVTEGNIGICVHGPLSISIGSVAAGGRRRLCLNRDRIGVVGNGGMLVISSMVDANRSLATMEGLIRTTNNVRTTTYTFLTRKSTTSHSSVVFLRGLPLFFGWLVGCWDPHLSEDRNFTFCAGFFG